MAPAVPRHPAVRSFAPGTALVLSGDRDGRRPFNPISAIIPALRRDRTPLTADRPSPTDEHKGNARHKGAWRLKVDQTLLTPNTAPDAGGEVQLKAPLAGWLMSLDEVDDPVFRGRVLGEGFAIDPTDGTLRAPCDGIITSLHRARHAVTLKTDGGAEILMHIGLDTVALKGEGFTAHVREGDRVASGDALIAFDLDKLAQVAKSLVVPVVLTSGETFAIKPIGSGQDVAAGDIVADVTPLTSEIAAAPEAASGAKVRLAAVVADPDGLHARPAGLLAEAAKGFKSAIELQVEARGTRASARSAVALMLLGAAGGDVVTVEATGPDAAEAAQRIASMLGAPADDAPAAEPPPPKAAAAPPFAPGEATTLEGVTAAPGLAIGTAVRIEREDIEVPETGGPPGAEAEALRAALRRTAADIRATIVKLGKAGGQQAEILGAHLAFVEDPDLIAAAEVVIRGGKSAAFAWKATVDRQIDALKRVSNPVLAGRAADLEDIQHRVLLTLAGKDSATVALPPAAVLVADDLLPSQLADLDASRIAGICLARGGTTSHLAILAASKGLPTVVAAGPDVLRVPDGATLVIEADKGVVRVNPPAAEVAALRAARERRQKASAANRAATKAECRMADGTRIEVVANLGGPGDVKAALEAGAEGCGLMRSEFIFLKRNAAPTEDEQLAQYQAIATGLEGRPLIIRTLDAGADKDVPYAGLPKEDNPALGLRGVRIALWQPELLATQIRAILRVEPFGQVRLLLPMISTLDDLNRVRAVIDQESVALDRAQPIEVGIMVEVPSAALIADRFAAEADFFSIGTNDLTQYTLAMDRMSANLAKQLDPFHPAVLRLIGLTCQGAQTHQRWVGVCGSLASVPLAAPLLIGLGVTELSATPKAIPDIKALVRTLTLEACRDVAERALAQESGADVRRLLASLWPDI
jgi:phosphocarrier protein FPr/phosphocarrier protein